MLRTYSSRLFANRTKASRTPVLATGRLWKNVSSSTQTSLIALNLSRTRWDLEEAKPKLFCLQLRLQADVPTFYQQIDTYPTNLTKYFEDKRSINLSFCGKG